MTNKVLLERLSEMNISVKSHMSVVDEETASRTKEVILGQKREVLVEKRVKETVIRRRKKLVKKPSEAPVVPPEATEQPADVSTAVSEKTSPKTVVKLVEPEAAETKIEEEKPAEVALEPKDMKTRPEETEPARKVKAKKKPKAKKDKPAKIIKLPEVKPLAPAGDELTRETGSAAPVEEQPEPESLVGAAEEKQEPHPVAKRKSKKKDRRSPEVLEEDKRFLKKKITFRKKEVLEKSDLYDGKVLKGRKGRRVRRGKVAVKGEATLITTPKAIKRRIKIDEAIMVSDLAKRMGIKAGEVIKRLMAMGVMASLNQAIDLDTATVIDAAPAFLWTDINSPL